MVGGRKKCTWPSNRVSRRAKTAPHTFAVQKDAWHIEPGVKPYGSQYCYQIPRARTPCTVQEHGNIIIFTTGQ